MLALDEDCSGRGGAAANELPLARATLNADTETAAVMWLMLSPSPAEAVSLPTKDLTIMTQGGRMFTPQPAAVPVGRWTPGLIPRSTQREPVSPHWGIASAREDTHITS